MTEFLELTLPNQRSAISGIQDRIEAFAGEHGLPGRVLYDIQLALEEHLTNLISYGFADGQDHDIRLRLCMEPEAVRIDVEDDGIPFNPLDHPAPDLDKPIEERPIGGLGIYMMRKAMDDVAYHRGEGKNSLVMVRRIPAD